MTIPSLVHFQNIFPVSVHIDAVVVKHFLFFQVHFAFKISVLQILSDSAILNVVRDCLIIRIDEKVETVQSAMKLGWGNDIRVSTYMFTNRL